jgi:hypothetical protein
VVVQLPACAFGGIATTMDAANIAARTKNLMVKISMPRLISAAVGRPFADTGDRVSPWVTAANGGIM